MSTTSVEFRTGKLYGGLWTQYDDDLFLKSLELFQERWLANGEDVAMITAEIQDAQGRELVIADNPLTFKVSGGGKLIGLGNGDPSSHELDTADSRRAFNGLCQAIVQTSKTADEIHVEASSRGLQPGTVSLTGIVARR